MSGLNFIFNRKFRYQKGSVDRIRLIGLGFLVITLVATLSTVDNPLKRQLISSFASGYSDSLIRQRERTGMCVGSGCLAVEVISNASKQGNNNTDAKSAQTAAEQKIIDTYNNSLKGDLAALATLKTMNVGLANQVQATLNSQLTADQAAIVNSYNSGNYTLNSMNEITAQVAQICKDKPTACSALNSNNQQLTVNTQSQITLNQVIGNNSNKNVFVNPESLIAQNQINNYLDNYKPPVVTVQQMQQQSNTTNLTGTNNNIVAVTPPKYTSQADCQRNSGSNCGNYATQDENKNTLFTNLANSIGNVINDISAQSKKSFGSGSMFEGQNLSLGGEQPMIVAPQSVLLSENPQDFVEFYKGVGYSMGAGSLAAAAVFSPALPGIALETLTTNAGLAYALNTFTNITSVATVGYLTYGAASGPGTQAYDNAQNILVNGYLADPASMTQMFQRAGQVVSDTGAVISSIQRVPQITAPEPLVLENPNVIVIEQDGQMTFTASSLRNASSTTPSIVTNMADAAETSSSLALNTIRNNTAALSVANPADSMLFAPTYNNLINQALAVDSPGFHPNNVTSIPRWDQSTAVVNEVDLPSDLMNSLVPESLRPNLPNNVAQSNQNGNIFNNSNTTQLSQTVNDVSNAISDSRTVVSGSNRTPIVTTITNWVRNAVGGTSGQSNITTQTAQNNVIDQNMSTQNVVPVIVDSNNLPNGTRPEVADAIRYANDHGIDVYSLPPDQMGLTNPSIEGGARTTGGIARYPNAQSVTISERLFLPQHPDAARIIYHEVAGHMIGQQFPPSTLADRIINEILAQRTASLMLTNRGLPAYPNGFANLDSLVNRYRELTGIDPYVVLDIITRAPIVERVENLTGVSLNNPNSPHGLIQNTIDSFLPFIPKQIAQLFPNIFGINLPNAPLSLELVRKSFGIIMPDVGDGLVTYMRAHNGSLDGATIRFGNGRVWSAYYDKTTSPYNELRSRGGEAAVDEMVSRLDAGFRKANSKLFLSPKSRSTTTDHIVYIDITQSRSSSIAKASKFFNNAAKTIIDDVNNKYGIVDGSRKVSDYMYTGIGEETPVIFKNDDGLISQEAEKNAIQGALLGSAGPVVPESLKGDDYEPIIEYRGKENADVVVPIKKNITLYGNVIKKSDVGVIIPDTPSGIVATPEEIDKITKSVGFDNHRTPQDIISLFDPEAQSQFGNKEIRVKLEDTTAIKIEHDLGEGAGISVDVSPYSDMKETLREITGVSGSDEEIGLNQIMARVLADSKKVGSANKIAGDGLEIFIKKLTPSILRNLLDLSTSINTHLENALNGAEGYSQFELKVAHLLDLHFKGQVLVKIGAVNTKATFVAYEANDDGYIPTEIITEKSTDPYMATSKNFKKAYGVDKKVVTLSPELIKDFAPKELSDVGIKVDSDPLTGDVLLTELPITNSPPSPSINIQDRTKELINNAQNFVEDKIRTIKGINLFNKAETPVNDIQVGHSSNPLVDTSGLFPNRISLPFLEPQVLNTTEGSSNLTTQQSTIKIANIINGQNSYFKTGTGIPLWQTIGGALALYILDRDQINKFLRELYTTPPSNMYKAFGKAVSNLRNNGSTTLTNQNNIPAPTVVENEQLNKVGIFMQRNNLTVKQIINPWGTTLLELGCGPSSAINAFTLLGIKVDPQNIINGFYWDPETHQTGASAVLLSLQQNGVSGAVSYGLQNQITDATKISSYTGMLIYGGTASNNTEKKNHIAIITCNMGNCYSIDSYFSNGKPVKCTVQSSSSIQCGDYNYHVGETKGNADALLPIIDSDKNAILPSLTTSLTPVKSDTESQSAPQVITSTDNQVGPEKDLFNDKVVYKNFTTADNILYHVVNFDLNNVNMFVDSHFGQRTTTSNFLETNGLDIAINGDGWIKAYDKKDPSIFLGYQTGFSISNGNVNPLYNNKNQIMYLDSEHKMQFVDNPKDIPSNVEYAVSFVNWLVEDGQISTQVTNRAQDYLNPRTAIGITKDNQAFIIVTDGKEYSSGMLMKDLAQLMKDMGAVNAVMFDGGTNSTMVINGEGTVEKNCNDGGECQVANHVGFKIIP